MRNTVSNGHGKRNPLAMASTASERSSTLPWQMSMIESSGGGVSGRVSGRVSAEVGDAVRDEIGDEVCSGVGGVLEVGDEVCGVLEVGTLTRADSSLNVGLNAAACSARAACSLCSGAN